MESDEQEFALPVAIDLPQNYYRLKPTGMAGKGVKLCFGELKLRENRISNPKIGRKLLKMR